MMLNRLSVRQCLWIICVGCLGLLAFGLYLQHVEGLEPCPMCIVQRYAFILVALVAGIAAIFRSRATHAGGLLLMLLAAGLGAFTAARQSWLQWYPPEVASCGRDFFGMIETFPLQRAIPMIFKGSGDCAAIDWRFLGGSIANWSFLCFCAVLIVAFWLLRRNTRAA